MRLQKSQSREDFHHLRLDTAREVFGAARANGLWRFGTLRLLGKSLLANEGIRAHMYLDTESLEIFQSRLKRPEIDAYLGRSSLQEAQPNPIPEPSEALPAA